MLFYPFSMSTVGMQHIAHTLSVYGEYFVYATPNLSAQRSGVHHG